MINERIEKFEVEFLLKRLKEIKNYPVLWLAEIFELMDYFRISKCRFKGSNTNNEELLFYWSQLGYRNNIETLILKSGYSSINGKIVIRNNSLNLLLRFLFQIFPI